MSKGRIKTKKLGRYAMEDGRRTDRKVEKGSGRKESNQGGRKRLR